MNLREHGYERTEGECPDCDEGVLYVNSFELVCEECGIVIRKGEDPPDGGGPIQYFRSNRDEFTYDNSGEVICPGGFEFAYYGDGIYGSGDEEEA